MVDDIEITEKITEAIRTINESDLSAQEKAAVIKNIDAVSREVLFEFLNEKYRTGPDLAEFVANYVGKDRPIGGPSTRGTR